MKEKENNPALLAIFSVAPATFPIHFAKVPHHVIRQNIWETELDTVDTQLCQLRFMWWLSGSYTASFCCDDWFAFNKLS